METGTSSYYTALAQTTQEPVLAEICRLIAADEFRHFKLFYDNMRRYLVQDRISFPQRLWIAAGRIRESEDDEMAFATGRHMCCTRMSSGFEVDHVAGLIRLVYKDRIDFHKGDAEIAPGVSLHQVGGHTAGMQIVRVHTARGWVVLASDASHYYEHFEKKRVFHLVYHLGQAIEGYDTLHKLAQSPRHIIPGHDPLVVQRYPAVSPELDGIAMQLDKDPIRD